MQYSYFKMLLTKRNPTAPHEHVWVKVERKKSLLEDETSAKPGSQVAAFWYEGNVDSPLCFIMTNAERGVLSRFLSVWFSKTESDIRKQAFLCSVRLQGAWTQSGLHHRHTSLVIEWGCSSMNCSQIRVDCISFWAVERAGCSWLLLCNDTISDHRLLKNIYTSARSHVFFGQTWKHTEISASISNVTQQCNIMSS